MKQTFNCELTHREAVILANAMYCYIKHNEHDWLVQFLGNAPKDLQFSHDAYMKELDNLYQYMERFWQTH